MNQSTVGRWLRGDYSPTDAATVAAFASGHGRNVLEAFVAAGMLDEVDAGNGLPQTSRDYLAALRRHTATRARVRGVARQAQTNESA